MLCPLHLYDVLLWGQLWCQISIYPLRVSVGEGYRTLWCRLPNLRLGKHLFYLFDQQKRDIIQLVETFPNLFPDRPSRNSVHIYVGSVTPIKWHAYCVKPSIKGFVEKKEEGHLLAHGLAEPSFCAWHYPCLLVSKQIWHASSVLISENQSESLILTAFPYLELMTVWLMLGQHSSWVILTSWRNIGWCPW